MGGIIPGGTIICARRLTDRVLVFGTSCEGSIPPGRTSLLQVILLLEI